MSQTTTKTRGSHFRDLLIAGLVGFAIASLLMTGAVIAIAAVAHSPNCTLNHYANE